jgi:Rha family phage regulatory protein
MRKKQLMIPLDEANMIIQINNGQPWTDSRLVAEKFKKNHKDVLRAIRNMECSFEFNERNFEPVEYVDEKGESRPMIRMTRDGFSLLAMGFTGKEAMIWKEKYISAFNQMEHELTRQEMQKHDAVWQQTRLSGKIARLELTDAVQEFVEYAHAQGSTNARMYYTSITMMEYRALFLIGKAVGDGFRDKLTALQNSFLTTAESIAQRALREGMTKKLHYKQIYILAKERVEQFALMIGKSHPGDGKMARSCAGGLTMQTQHRA